MNSNYLKKVGIGKFKVNINSFDEYMDFLTNLRIEFSDMIKNTPDSFKLNSILRVTLFSYIYDFFVEQIFYKREEEFIDNNGNKKILTIVLQKTDFSNITITLFVNEPQNNKIDEFYTVNINIQFKDKSLIKEIQGKVEEKHKEENLI